MTIKKTALRRLATGVGALALSMVGLAGLGTAASAAGFEPPVEPEDGTSLTLHKHVYDETPLAGDPLAGVEFTVQEIGVLVGDPAVCTAIDLGTPEGWQQVTAAIDDFMDGSLAAPFCELGTALIGTTDVNGEVTFDDVWGLYLVTETDSGPNLISGPALPFLVTVPYPTAPNVWDYDVDAYPKNVLTDFTPTKVVGTTNVDDDVVPAAFVPWTVTVPIPVASYPYNAISVTDTTAGTGHTFVEFTSLSFNGVDLVAADYTVTGTTVTLTEAGLAKVNAVVTGADAVTANLVVNFTTQVAEDIEPGTYTNQASATLNGQTKQTNIPKTIWGELVIDKYVFGDEEVKLAGAKFVVYEAVAGACAAYDSATTDVVATGTTDADGNWEQVLWIANAQSEEPGPWEKEYCLVETVAPDGYILDSTPRMFTLWTMNDSFTTTVSFPNTPPEGPDLPMTGAGGTLALTLAGLALVGLGSGGILLSRRSRTQA